MRLLWLRWISRWSAVKSVLKLHAMNSAHVPHSNDLECESNGDKAVSKVYLAEK